MSVCTLQQIFKISVKIVQFLPGLINDQFGNYIIQFLLDIEELDFYLLAEIFNRLSNELCQLSCLKFSSNVVEKFIKKLFNIITDEAPRFCNKSNTNDSNDDVVNAAMRILLTIIDIFTLNLNILIRDNFGNYALQTLLDVKNYSQVLEYSGNKNVAKSPKLASFSHDFTTKIGNLVVLTKELLPSIKTTSYAKKIKLKVKSYTELTGIALTDVNPKKNSTKNNSTINNQNSKNNGGLNTHFTHYNSNNNNSSKNHNGNHRNNNNKNTVGMYQKQHTRHFSLPANAYHRRSSSSNSLPYAVIPQQPNAQNSHHSNGLTIPYATDQASSYDYLSRLGDHEQFNDSITQNLQKQQTQFMGSNLQKPNSNPNLHTLPGLRSSSNSLTFMNDSISNNTNNSSSSNSFFPATAADPTMMNNFAFSGGSQSNFTDSSFSEQRITSNPFPVYHHQPAANQQNFSNYIPAQAGEGFMYLEGNTNEFTSSAAGFNFGFN